MLRVHRGVATGLVRLVLELAHGDRRRRPRRALRSQLHVHVQGPHAPGAPGAATARGRHDAGARVVPLPRAQRARVVRRVEQLRLVEIVLPHGLSGFRQSLRDPRVWPIFLFFRCGVPPVPISSRTASGVVRAFYRTTARTARPNASRFGTVISSYSLEATTPFAPASYALRTT